MKHKNKFYLIIIMLFSFILGCEKDDDFRDYEDSSTVNELPFEFKTVAVNGKGLRNYSTRISDKIDRFNSAILQKKQ